VCVQIICLIIKASFIETKKKNQKHKKVLELKGAETIDENNNKEEEATTAAEKEATTPGE
jgi:hypothetical protein